MTTFREIKDATLRPDRASGGTTKAPVFTPSIPIDIRKGMPNIRRAMASSGPVPLPGQGPQPNPATPAPQPSLGDAPPRQRGGRTRQGNQD
jgi:hypothetical protein